MGITAAPVKRNTAKIVLAVITALTLIATIFFWAAIKIFHLQAFPLYFAQLGLYLIFFMFAWWGLKQEQLSLPVNKWLIVEALAWSLVGWLVFILIIQLLGLVQISEAFLLLRKTPAWEIGAQMLSIWLFVGMGEEVLFRGYFLRAIWRHCTLGTDRRRMLTAALLGSAFFSLWHLPARINGILSGDMDWITLLVSLLVLFLLGLGFSYLFIRSGNIILVGLVHGIMDYPLIGKNTQISLIILLVAIGCVEIARLTIKEKSKETGLFAV